MKQKDPLAYIGRDLEAMSYAKNYYAWIIEGIRPYVGKRILEIGAGNGTFTDFLLGTRPIQIHSVEPSTKTYKEFVQKHAHNPRIISDQGTLRQHVSKFTGAMTSAVYINVMEHIEDDLAEFELAYKALKPGGKLIVYVPALQAIYGEFDSKVGHYRRYSKGRLKSLCEHAGFRIVRLHYSDVFGIIPWFINFRLLRKEDLHPKSVQFYDHFIVPLIKYTEKYLKPPIGKNLWLIAERPLLQQS